jgi:hypothetical protein
MNMVISARSMGFSIGNDDAQSSRTPSSWCLSYQPHSSKLHHHSAGTRSFAIDQDLFLQHAAWGSYCQGALMVRCVFVAVCAVGLWAGGAQAAPCALSGRDPVDAVRQMYVALAAGDRAGTLALFDRDAYLFDLGTRFTPEALTDLIIKAEAAGTKPQWTVERVESHRACNTAWATWANHGTFTTAAGSQPEAWLESGVFAWRKGGWKIRFMHSTAVPTAR